MFCSGNSFSRLCRTFSSSSSCFRCAALALIVFRHVRRLVRPMHIDFWTRTSDLQLAVSSFGSSFCRCFLVCCIHVSLQIMAFRHPIAMLCSFIFCGTAARPSSFQASICFFAFIPQCKYQPHNCFAVLFVDARHSFDRRLLILDRCLFESVPHDI